MKRLQNKVAVITGGNSGIGKGIAKRFLAEGAKVVIFGHHQDILDQAKAELGNDVLAVLGDLAQTADIKNLFAKTYEHFGKIDILIANAGVGERLHICDVDEACFDHTVNVNYRGTYFTIKYAIDYLNPSASVILIASCAAHITIKRNSVYASTKAALIKLAKNLAYDLSDQGIRVNSISPGYVQTPAFATNAEFNNRFLEEKKADIPLKRIGTPEDIANAAVFLASEQASYITGTDLAVDGGYSASFPSEV